MSEGGRERREGGREGERAMAQLMGLFGSWR